MTEEQLREIEERWEATTPGEWWVNKYATDMSCTEQAISVCGDDMTLMNMGIDDVAMPDASFVVAAHNNDVPVLLAEVRRLQKLMPPRGIVEAIKHNANNWPGGMCSGDIYVWSTMWLKAVPA